MEAVIRNAIPIVHRITEAPTLSTRRTVFGYPTDCPMVNGYTRRFEGRTGCTGPRDTIFCHLSNNLGAEVPVCFS